VKWGKTTPDSYITTRVMITGSVLHPPDLDTLITDQRLLAQARSALLRVRGEVIKGCGIVLNRKPS
jgi:hypothetical protein